jgi:hypothetical protein
MLIEFTISNFRSFREPQTFSMVAASQLKKKENVIKPNVVGEKKLPGLLKVAAIYGPNASGKSNLILAFNAVRRIAGMEPSNTPRKLPISPFKFDKALLSQPSRFEVHFIASQCRYEFVLAATADRIIEEQLVAYPSGKETLLYSRTHSENGELYRFGELEGGEELHDAWKRLTGPQTLFIYQAVANSQEGLDQLRPALAWLQRGVTVITGDMRAWSQSSQGLAKEEESFATKIASFLQDIDVPVTNIKVEAVPSAADALNEQLGLGISDASSPRRNERLRTTLTHQTLLGTAEFDFDEESVGTKNLFGFWLL